MNKLAVVTGASSGIGLEFSKLLAADGYDLLIAARDSKGLEAIANDLKSKHSVNVSYMAIDLSIPDSADKLWKKVESKNVDILINNAGFGDLKPLIEADWEKLDSMIALNITTLTRLSQLAATSMSRHGSGHILNLASTAAFIPGPGMAVYYATKSYVLSFSEALSEELLNTGVSVTSLCPGPTATHFAQSAGAVKSNLFKGHLPTAKDVAEYGYKMMLEKKVIAVHGFRNRLQSIFVPRILPRSLVRKIVNNTQNNKSN